MGPVTARERLEVLDVLRGMALFGIIASNMRAFNGPFAAYFDHSLMWQEPANRVAQAFLDVFISGKFITLFSFLFGIGFAIQMERAQARGVERRTFYLRRLTVLLAMGLLHMFFLWPGDILTIYALMGFGLYLFRRRSQKTVLVWSVALYAWPWLTTGGFAIARAFGVPMGEMPETTPQEIQRLIQVYSSGSYAEMFRERLKDNVMNAFFVVFYAPRLLGIFLFGLWVWRSGILRALAAHEGWLRRGQRWGFAVGLPLNVAMMAVAEIWHPGPMDFGYGLLGGVAIPLLSMGYACTIAVLSLENAWKRRLRPLGAVGRMALTNYLMQTVLCTTLYYSYGFGLYGRVGPLAGLIPTFAIYAAQVAMSVWWMVRFPYGPMEWLWRRLTYGRLREESVAAGI